MSKHLTIRVQIRNIALVLIFRAADSYCVESEFAQLCYFDSSIFLFRDFIEYVSIFVKSFVFGKERGMWGHDRKW